MPPIGSANGPHDIESAVDPYRLFVGRQRELDVMIRALEDSRSGRGRLVLVAGEPRADLAASFVRQDQIDEYRLHVHPIVMPASRRLATMPG